MWHRVAPVMAQQFTVICPDLRGYGDSAKPASDEKHLNYSKRAMATDMVEIMQSLGFDRFVVAGHDRGARVAHRLALDHADKIDKLALLDIVPTAYAFAHANMTMAIHTFHWFFLIQPDDLPETLILSNTEFCLRWIIDHWCGTPGAITEAAFSEYLRCFDAETVRATCEDYRAAATIDLLHDAEDRGRRIETPLLLLWSATGTGGIYDVPSVWSEYATQIEGRLLNCGHFLAEEAPDETAAELIRFFS
jgi:haloacetate dehalogenase